MLITLFAGFIVLLVIVLSIILFNLISNYFGINWDKITTFFKNLFAFLIVLFLFICVLYILGEITLSIVKFINIGLIW
jgi:hypothetical protein